MKIAVIYHSETGNVKQMAQLVAQGCQKVADTKVKVMPVDNVDDAYVEQSAAVILGSPTYMATCSWQMKKYLDSGPKGLAGKLGGVFASQNWPGGGGASFAEMTIIAGMLVYGMIIYSGGVCQGEPYLHFGAVSARAPEETLYHDRCLKLGENLAQKAHELFDKA